MSSLTCTTQQTKLDPAGLGQCLLDRRVTIPKINFSIKFLNQIEHLKMAKKNIKIYMPK